MADPMVVTPEFTMVHNPRGDEIIIWTRESADLAFGPSIRFPASALSVLLASLRELADAARLYQGPPV